MSNLTSAITAFPVPGFNFKDAYGVVRGVTEVIVEPAAVGSLGDVNPGGAITVRYLEGDDETYGPLSTCACTCT